MIKPRIQTTHHASSTTMEIIDDDGPARIEVEWISDMRVYVSVIDGLNAASVQIHKSLAKEFFLLLAGGRPTNVYCGNGVCTKNKHGMCTKHDIHVDLCSAVEYDEKSDE